MRIFFNWSVLAIFTACLATPSLAGVFYDDGATTMHFAFEGSPNGDRPIVRPPAFYHADDGFGFVDSPLLTGNRLGVSAPKYFRFDVNLPDGNYDVAVTLGNPDYDSITTVKAEGHRPMLLDVRVGAGENVTKTFTVNVRHGADPHYDVDGNLDPNDHSVSLDLDGCLNLEFVGVNPSMTKLDIQPNPTAISVYLAGDDKVCDSDHIRFTGWGQMLPIFFKPGEIAVSNQASFSGITTIEEARLKSIDSTIKHGDYLLIEFDDGAIYARPGVADRYKNFLRTYIGTARKHGATPVLVTPVPQRTFFTGTKLFNDEADPGWVRELAAEEKVSLIDLTASATAFINQLGPDESKKAFAYYPASTFPNQPEAMADNGHFSAYGALEMAKLVAQAIKDQKLDLTAHLTGNLATNPDPAKFPAHLGYDFLLNNK